MRFLSLAGLAAALAPFPFASAAAQQREAQVAVDRIAALDDAGPRIDAVIVYDRDAAQKAAMARGPLAGRTVLVKDNIETREWPTTAGSLALAGNRTGRDAPLIARLRAAGGVVLGKTNLSEWANMRSTRSASGWSAVGGLTRNPHATDRSACGSSSGSGAAVAAGMEWAAIGTETDGSITCPASVNGVVGFKPTVGMVSRTYVVPLSASQDTPGPMALNVRDAAMLLTAIAGSDPADPATAEADRHKSDFAAGLVGASLKGIRIGVLRNQIGPRTDVARLFETALADLRRAGAVLVDVHYDEPRELGQAELTVLQYELREGLAAYLANSPAQLPARDLAGVKRFNIAHSDTELRWFGQELFDAAERTTDPAAYRAARETSLRLAGADGIDKLLGDHRVSILIAPTTGPAWVSDLMLGDNYPGGIGAGTVPAVAGYPHLSVPMGAVEGLPVGLSLIGAKWQDLAVLRAGVAYEQVRTAPLARPGFKPWAPR